MTQLSTPEPCQSNKTVN